jgi:hypothetical protein
MYVILDKRKKVMSSEVNTHDDFSDVVDKNSSEMILIIVPI